MKYFERKRRQLFKNHYINGAEKSVSGVDSVDIKASAGVPFKSLKINGASALVPETDIMPNYIEYFKNIESYEFGSVSSVYEIPFPAEWLGKELSFSLVEKTKMKDITFGLSNGGGFFANSINLLGYNGELSTVKSSEFSHFRFTGIVDSDTFSEITNFWQNYAVKVIKDAEGESPTPSEPWTLKCLGDNGVTISLGEKTVSLPSTVKINGKDVQLLLSEYDNITVDGVQGRVVYTSYAFPYYFTGDETFQINSWAKNRGYGSYYQVVPKGYALTDSLACTHFKKGVYTENSTMVTQKNAFGYTGTWYIWFRSDGVQTTDEFKAWVKAQHEAGNPVYVIAKLKTPIEHDITDTDFGKALLSLCAPANDDFQLTVTGALKGASLSAIYYSTREEDTVNITVKYVDEGGNEINEPWINQARKGSKYLVIAPHIDGYVRVVNEVFGVADSDIEVILEYRR